MYKLIKSPTIVNEKQIFVADVLIKDDIISKIEPDINEIPEDCEIINAENLHLFPGVIDTHVHFREPGLTQKGDIYSESRAAAAGGVTSFIDMPNTIPPTTTNKLLQEKFKIAEQKSLINYSFYLGASENNLKEIKKVDVNTVAGIKLFLGSSTGNLAVKNLKKIEKIFKHSPIMISVHCEDDEIIKKNLERLKKFSANIYDISAHHKIRSNDACISSTKLATDLAYKHDKNTLILHVTTKDEINLLYENQSLNRPLRRIFSEICTNYLWEDFYKNKKTYNNKIKCNPAIKEFSDYYFLKDATLRTSISIISSDHAPHTLEEKEKNYLESPSGIPSVQHSLLMMIEFIKKQQAENKADKKLTKIAKYMSHNPANLFQIDRRGFIKEGYFADLVLVDLNKTYTVNKSNILYKCEWSPLEGHKFNSKIITTFVNGKIVYNNDNIIETNSAMKLKFNR